MAALWPVPGCPWWPPSVTRPSTCSRGTRCSPSRRCLLLASTGCERGRCPVPGLTSDFDRRAARAREDIVAASANCTSAKCRFLVNGRFIDLRADALEVSPTLKNRDAADIPFKDCFVRAPTDCWRRYHHHGRHYLHRGDDERFSRAGTCRALRAVCFWTVCGSQRKTRATADAVCLTKCRAQSATVCASRLPPPMCACCKREGAGMVNIGDEVFSPVRFFFLFMNRRCVDSSLFQNRSLRARCRSLDCTAQRRRGPRSSLPQL